MLDIAITDIFSTVHGNTGRLATTTGETIPSSALLNANGEVVTVGRSVSQGGGQQTYTYSGTLTVDKL